jgi:hypothetical protein
MLGHPPPSPDTHWIARINAVGKAQSRYLWLLLLAMLFFPALRETFATAGAKGTLKVPIVDLDLDARSVLAAGPLVISAVVLMVLGTIRALKEAMRKFDPQTLAAGELERFDENPTALDLILYTTASTRSWIAGVLFLVFPLLLLLGLSEAAWLWLIMPGAGWGGSAWPVLRWATLILWLPALWKTLEFFQGRVRTWRHGHHIKRLI